MKITNNKATASAVLPSLNENCLSSILVALSFSYEIISGMIPAYGLHISEAYKKNSEKLYKIAQTCGDKITIDEAMKLAMDYIIPE